MKILTMAFDQQDNIQRKCVIYSFSFKNKITINKDFNSHSSNKLIDAQKTPSDDNKNNMNNIQF